MKKLSFVKNLTLIFLSLFMLTSSAAVYANSFRKGAFAGKGETRLAFPGGFRRDFVEGQVLIKFKKGTFLQNQEKIKTKAGIKGTLKVTGPKNNKNIFLMTLKPGVTVSNAVSELKKNPDVISAEPNYVRKLNYVPNDPQFSNQWWLNNTGQTVAGVSGLSNADINAPEAWNLEKGYLNPVKVAVIDSGVDKNHPDLAGKIIPGYNWAGVSQCYANSGWSFGDSTNNKGFAQSIKGTGEKLTHIGLVLAKKGRPAGNITVSVRSRLTRGDLAFYTITPSKVSISPTEFYGKLSKPVTLRPGSNYYIVVSTDNNNKSNFYYFFDNSTEHENSIPDPYPNGHEYCWNGKSWKVYSSDDIYFRTNPNANPLDDVGHGTHVSGIIAANTGNAIGVAGVCPGAVIMPLKVADSSGSLTSEDIISAINYAADHGAKVINMSFGDTRWSKIEQQAVNYANSRGVVMFAAAGNSYGSSYEYPASYTNVISVGATDSRDNIADFSNHNYGIDVSAPGVDIISTMPTYSVSLTSEGYPRGYAYLSGTSMAAPMASGLGALVLSRNPNYSPAGVEQAIKNNADDKGSVGRDVFFGSGRINAFKTLNSFSAVTSDVTAPIIREILSSINTSSLFYSKNNDPIFSWNAFDYSGVAGYSYVFDRSPSTIPDTNSEGTVTAIKYNSRTNGKWYFHLRAVDKLNNWSSPMSLTVNIDRYKPKTYASKKAIVRKNKRVKLYWVVKDRYTDNKAYVIIKIKKGRSVKKTIKIGLTTINRTRYYRYRASLPKGKYYFYVYAKDQAGNNQLNVARNVLSIK